MSLGDVRLIKFVQLRECCLLNVEAVLVFLSTGYVNYLSNLSGLLFYLCLSQKRGTFAITFSICLLHEYS